MDIKTIGTILATGALGAAAALGLSLVGMLPAVNAEENSSTTAMQALMSPAKRLFPAPLDVNGLVRWNFEVDDSVSLEPIRQSTVNKIAFGKQTRVSIVETTSGIYSSDAMVNPHVRYPGINVTPRREARVMILDGFEWTSLTAAGGQSLTTIVPFDGGQLVVTDDSACNYTAKSVVC